MVEVGSHQALARLAVLGLELLGALGAVLLDVLHGVLEGLGLGERLFAVGESRAGQFAQLGDIFRGSFHSLCISLPTRGVLWRNVALFSRRIPSYHA